MWFIESSWGGPNVDGGVRTGNMFPVVLVDVAPQSCDAAPLHAPRNGSQGPCSDTVPTLSWATRLRPCKSLLHRILGDLLLCVIFIVVTLVPEVAGIRRVNLLIVVLLSIGVLLLLHVFLAIYLLFRSVARGIGVLVFLHGHVNAHVAAAVMSQIQVALLCV